jgi:hypothetical protein
VYILRGEDNMYYGIPQRGWWWWWEEVWIERGGSERKEINSD